MFRMAVTQPGHWNSQMRRYTTMCDKDNLQGKLSPGFRGQDLEFLHVIRIGIAMYLLFTLGIKKGL